VISCSVLDLEWRAGGWQRKKEATALEDAPGPRVVRARDRPGLFIVERCGDGTGGRNSSFVIG